MLWLSFGACHILISFQSWLPMQGVWERDEMRKNDSFDTFEEVLQIAMAQNVDLLLLGGDLFHDNKPSRTTIVKAVKLLTDYCMHDRPVTFEVLSDQRESFASG